MFLMDNVMLDGMGYSGNYLNRGVEDILFWKKTLEFLSLSFTLGNSRHNKDSQLEILENFVTHLGNSIAKNQDPWKFHMFSWSPLEIPLLF